MDKTIEYRCWKCHKTSELNVTIYAHDEFFMDENCEHCQAKIPSNIIDKILNDEVTDFVSSRADYIYETMRDK